MNALPSVLQARQPAVIRLTRALVLSVLTLGAAPILAAALSPAQQVFDEANTLLQQEYGGLSLVDRFALTKTFQLRLNAVCASNLSDCSEEKAYSVIEAEMAELGDEHSFFENPEDFEDFVTRATGGNRKQFGVKLAMLDKQNRVVTEVITDSAAQEAGLQRGDLIETLNGKPYVYEKLRAARESGSTIVLGILRLGQPRTVTLTSRESSTRDLPRLEMVPDEYNTSSIAVLRIPTFLSDGGIAQKVHQLVGQAQEKNLQGLIVDLRGNSGGSLSECDSAVSAFVPVVSRIARTAQGSSRTVVSRGTRLEDGRLRGGVRSPNLWQGPMAVLVDDISASCSEFFAYEIQYAKRGPVIGDYTAGVGNTATRVFQVGKGALQLTILNYAKPDGTPYPNRIVPDQIQGETEDDIRLLTQGVDSLLNAAIQALATAPTLSVDLTKSMP